MRPRLEGSICDDACEDADFLKFVDDEMKASFLQSLHTMRKHRLFCDVVLNVGNSDIHAHKNVLACVSPYFMELFSADQDFNNSHNNHHEDIPSFRLNGTITKNALQILVDYAYTAKLEVPDCLVKEVYMAAWKLRMDRCVKQCAQHLISDLSPETSIEIRSLPGINKNTSFVSQVDAFINSEFAAVSQTAGFLQLSGVQIDVLYQTKQEMSLVTHNTLSRLVLDWIKRQLVDETLSDTQLIERTHLLYLAMDNSLQDCSDLPPGHESESDLVQDYKKMVLKCPNNTKQRRKHLAAPVKPRVLIYSRDLGEDDNEIEIDWNLIASAKCGETTFIALATVNGRLMRLSVKLRLNTVPQSPLNGAQVNLQHPLNGNTEALVSVPIATPIPVVTGSTSGGGTSSTATTSTNGSIDGDASNRNSSELELFCEVAAMSGAKCGLGVAEFKGKLLVCGGYDRAECLKKVESYCPDTNTWTRESNMMEARGRVQVAVLDDTVYAVGGSNGTTELDTVECLKLGEQKWQKRKRLPLARSNAGTCALNNKIYCIGGWNGQIGIKQCDVYTPETDQWTQIANLNTGRYQAGVTAFNKKLWAVGGSDAWNCLSSVESYDPEQDKWSYAPQLLTPRRGCGVAEFQNKLYAVGGSDGQQSLCSTEVYDENTKSWVVGPSLNIPRSNVSVVVVQDKLYAIGGFSGKTFLNTIEYLDPATNEWTSFVPHQQDAEKIRQVILDNIDILSSGNSSECEGDINTIKKKNDIKKPIEIKPKNSIEALDEVQKIIASLKIQQNNDGADHVDNNHQQNGNHTNGHGNIINGCHQNGGGSVFNDVNQPSQQHHHHHQQEQQQQQQQEQEELTS